MITQISKKMMTKSFKKTKYLFRKTPEMIFDDEIGVYVHVPFCYTKCTFCPFYKELFNESDKEKYVEAIIKEINLTSVAKKANWVYFGGGTPNTLTLDDLAKIVNSLQEKIEIKNMGIELLPSLVTNTYLDGLKEIGFTKISIGIETFSKETYKKTGRKSTTFNHIQKIITYAKSIGLFVAVDLMIGLPEQTKEVFESDIKQIIEIKPNQITIYPYMIIRGVQAKPSSTTKEQFVSIEEASKELLEAGYDRKSVWIFTLPNTSENDVYDSSKDELVNDYCGFGPASFSTCKYWKVVKPELDVWLDNLTKGKSLSFVAPKMKSTDDWRNFANRIYDLKLESSYKFPFYIRMFDFILRLTGFHKNGYLTNKGRYFSHEITKAVVESLPFPVQNEECVTNYDEYREYKSKIAS